MRTNQPPAKKSRLPRAAAWIAGAAGALALAFGVGRHTAGPTPASPPRPEREPSRGAGYASPAQQPSPWTQPASPPPAPAAGAPSSAVAARSAETPGAQVRTTRSTYRVTLPPDQLELHKAEVVANVEEQRRRVVSTCWPREGLPRGQKSTTVTYNVTFNPEGREVGRGIVQDRRAPAGKFGRCLGQLQEMPFSISPPGTYVTLRVPVSYP